eukprot:86152-Pyramimonas_sp.AAC.1
MSHQRRAPSVPHWRRRPDNSQKRHRSRRPPKSYMPHEPHRPLRPTRPTGRPDLGLRRVRLPG